MAVNTGARRNTVELSTLPTELHDKIAQSPAAADWFSPFGPLAFLSRLMRASRHWLEVCQRIIYKNLHTPRIQANAPVIPDLLLSLTRVLHVSNSEMGDPMPLLYRVKTLCESLDALHLDLDDMRKRDVSGKILLALEKYAPTLQGLDIEVGTLPTVEELEALTRFLANATGLHELRLAILSPLPSEPAFASLRLAVYNLKSLRNLSLVLTPDDMQDLHRFGAELHGVEELDISWHVFPPYRRDRSDIPARLYATLESFSSSVRSLKAHGVYGVDSRLPEVPLICFPRLESLAIGAGLFNLLPWVDPATRLFRLHLTRFDIFDVEIIKRFASEQAAVTLGEVKMDHPRQADAAASDLIHWVKTRGIRV